MKLTDLRRSGVKAYRNELLKMGKRPTAEKAFMVLKCVLEEAAENEFVAQNVARAVKIGGKPKRPLIMGRDFPSPQEALQIMEEAEDPFRPLAITGLCSGMRAGELRALLWENLDFERGGQGVIMVRQAAEPKSKTRGPTKTDAGVRDIPMWVNVKKTLQEWWEKCTPCGRLTGFGAPEYKVLKAQELINDNPRTTRRELAELLGVSPNVISAVKKAMPISSNSRRWLVFPCRWDGNMQTHCAINNQFQRLQLKLGMVGPDGKPKYSMHSLRHFYASYMISEGYDPVLVATYLGHTSAKMVLDVYGHFMPGREDIPARLAASERRLFATPKLLQQNRNNEPDDILQR